MNVILSTLIIAVCFRYAGNVCVGDEVLVDGNGKLIPTQVVNVSTLFMQGKRFITALYKEFLFKIKWFEYKFIFNKFSLFIIVLFSCFPGAHVPLTKEGNIIVDGVLASCYASVIDHQLAHLTMVHLRWFSDIIQKIFGEDDEISAFVRVNEELGKMMLPSGQLW